MVVPGDSPREMPETEMAPSDRGGGGNGDLYGGGEGGNGDLYGGGGGGNGDLYGGGGGGLGCEDDEIFLLPLTALAMEADDLRWVTFQSWLKRLILDCDHHRL